MKRLLHVISSLTIGGATTQLKLLVEALPRKEFAVDVCALGPDVDVSVVEPLEDAGARLHILHDSRIMHPAAWYRLMRLMRHVRPDVVQTWDLRADWHGRTAAYGAGVSMILGCERGRREDRRLAVVFAQQLLAHVTHAILVNHDALKQRLIARGISADKIVTIGEGAYVPRANRLPLAGAREFDLRAELELPRRVRLIGVLGPLVREKRLKDALWAIDLLKCVRDDTHLLVIGDGPQRAELEAYTRDIELSDKVHFLGNREDLDRLWPQIDVFWLTSESETFPNGLAEAMYHGRPVVATALPTLAELVVPGKTGEVIAVGNRGELARVTQPLLDDPQRAQRLGEQAREHIHQHFSAKDTVEQYMRLYRQCLPGGGPLDRPPHILTATNLRNRNVYGR